MYFINPVITDLAQTRVNEAINANQPLIFTKLSIGKGKQVGDLKKVSSLKTHFMDLSVAKELQGETTKLFSRLSNEGFVDEAHITELGIFAKVGNAGTEFLYMYTCADQGDIVPPANQGAYIRTYRFETTLRSDGELTINVVGGQGIFLTPEDLEEHTNNKSNPHNVTKEQIGLINATASVDGLMSKGDKFKLDTVELGANNYTHPATHPPTIIAQTSTGRFVSDAEKSTWNAKAGTSVATTSSNGLMASADKSKLNGINSGAQVNPTISTQSQAEAGTDNTTMMTPLRTKQAIEKLAPIPPLASNIEDGLMVSSDKAKLDGLEISSGFISNDQTIMTSAQIKEYIGSPKGQVVHNSAKVNLYKASGYTNNSNLLTINFIRTLKLQLIRENIILSTTSNLEYVGWTDPSTMVIGFKTLPGMINNEYLLDFFISENNSAMSNIQLKVGPKSVPPGLSLYTNRLSFTVPISDIKDLWGDGVSTFSSFGRVKNVDAYLLKEGDSKLTINRIPVEVRLSFKSSGLEFSIYNFSEVDLEASGVYNLIL